MFRRPSPLLLGLALCAMAWAQVFGLTRGYLCDCGGRVEITSADHCHGPHGDACHEQAEADIHHSDDGATLPGETEEHTPLTVTLLAKQQSQVSGLAAPAMAWIAALPEWAFVPASVKCAVVQPGRDRDDGGGGQRQWPHLLTRCIVLRV